MEEEPPSPVQVPTSSPKVGSNRRSQPGTNRPARDVRRRTTPTLTSGRRPFVAADCSGRRKLEGAGLVPGTCSAEAEYVANTYQVPRDGTQSQQLVLNYHLIVVLGYGLPITASSAVRYCHQASFALKKIEYVVS
ncbi:hypothetical protein chiPu_0004939 [Chiloscyllium punctatum]|uniref:Uncharacterized protein n=1 Tax=Chiloscyllium punctatum TaxID=137246 RepID=A0A401S7Z5_CHIPU|nr:hypothetical protein [Chiloscyllium punctatum]